MIVRQRSKLRSSPSHTRHFFDDSSCKQGAGARFLLLTPNGEEFKYKVHLNFNTTNNMVEYEALIFGLSTTLPLGV
jgi:ribonuclease HI